VRFWSLSPLRFGGSRGEHASEEKLGYGICMRLVNGTVPEHEW